MQTLLLNRNFLKKPQNGSFFLLLITTLAYIVMLVNRPDRIFYLSQNLTINYISKLVFGAVLPEMISLIIFITLINSYHQLIKLDKVELSFVSIAQYELKFLPLFATSFFFFFPITLHLRFLIREFPYYDLDRYMNVYIINGFSVGTYFLYLPFVFVLGYVLLNVSMLIDFIKSPAVAETEKKDEEITKIEAKTMPVDDNYLKIIEGKVGYDTFSLNIEDCYYFMTIDDHNYVTEHVKGRFRIAKSVAIIEKELNPIHFFKCNRKTIINLNYVSSFVHLDNRRYNLTMKEPVLSDFIISRARIQPFKEALKNNVEAKLSI